MALRRNHRQQAITSASSATLSPSHGIISLEGIGKAKKSGITFALAILLAGYYTWSSSSTTTTTTTINFDYRSWLLPQQRDHAHPVINHRHSSSSLQRQVVIPSLSTSQHGVAGHQAARAVEKVFQYTQQQHQQQQLHGWIHVNALALDDIENLRQLARTIMNRTTLCARPKVLGVELAPGLEYCAWKDDVVSHAALNQFSWETQLWGWVLQQYRDLPRLLRQYNLTSPSSKTTPTTSTSNCELAFLDAGVNIGSWASPLRVALPTSTPYLGIEGSPSTGAIAIANLRTSIEHHVRSGHQAHVAPTALLPFALVSQLLLCQARALGGVCFEQEYRNVGAQGVRSVGSQNCPPHSVAGAALLSQALLDTVNPLFSSCSGTLDWPRIYIAKFDVQGFEFKALVTAVEWLTERPPCYLILEMLQTPHVVALMELLADVGYDSVWRTHSTYRDGKRTCRHDEFPPQKTPYWSQSQNSSVTMHAAIRDDMKLIPQGSDDYKDYIFGFENVDMCLRRLLT